MYWDFSHFSLSPHPEKSHWDWSELDQTVHLPDVAHKVLSSVLCLFWLRLAELVQSDELNSFIAMWQEDVQSAASNLPALFKGLNSSWPWPQTASCLALGGSGILACFIARDPCTKPGRVPLLILLLSLEPGRNNSIKKSSQRKCVCAPEYHPPRPARCRVTCAPPLSSDEAKGWPRARTNLTRW